MINLTTRAIAELNRIRQKDSYSNQLRVNIIKGGCLDYAYEIQFDEEIKKTDFTFNHDSGMLIIADAEIYHQVENLTIDYLEDLMGGAFQFKNSDIAHHCSCGLSFSLDG